MDLWWCLRVDRRLRNCRCFWRLAPWHWRLRRHHPQGLRAPLLKPFNVFRRFRLFPPPRCHFMVSFYQWNSLARSCGRPKPAGGAGAAENNETESYQNKFYTTRCGTLRIDPLRRIEPLNLSTDPIFFHYGFFQVPWWVWSIRKTLSYDLNNSSAKIVGPQKYGGDQFDAVSRFRIVIPCTLSAK